MHKLHCFSSYKQLQSNHKRRLQNFFLTKLKSVICNLTYRFDWKFISLLKLDMAKRVRIFWANPKNTRLKPDFFDLKQKRVDPWPDPCFVRVNPTWHATWPEQFFFKLFFWVKKILKLRQYWFNCLLWALRKQLIHIHNCMQINWKMNS